MELEEEQEAVPMEVEIPEEPPAPMGTEEILVLPKLMSMNDFM